MPYKSEYKNMFGYCGYCPNCKEFKDDDCGQWSIEDNEIILYRGCRDCFHTLTPMETIKEHLPELFSEAEKTPAGCI